MSEELSDDRIKELNDFSLEELLSASRQVKSVKAAQYGVDMHEMHPVLHSFITSYSAILRDTFPQSPETEDGFTRGARMGYALLSCLAKQGSLELPDIESKQETIGASETWQAHILEVRKLYEVLQRGELPSADSDLFGLFFRTEELQGSLEPFFEIGLRMYARSKQVPPGQIREIVGQSALLGSLEVALSTGQENFLIDTRESEEANNFMRGFSEVVLALRAAKDRIKARSILEDL